MAHDLPAAVRCPLCLAPLLEYVHHPHGVRGSVRRRWECERCDFVREATEGEDATETP